MSRFDRKKSPPPNCAAGRIRRVRSEIDNRIHQRLEGNPGSVARLRQLTDHRGQVAARAVPEHGDPAGVAVEFARRVYRPLDRGIRIVNGRGKWMLRGQPIVDGNHHGVRVLTVEARDRIVRVEVPGHEAGAVKMHQIGNGRSARPARGV